MSRQKQLKPVTASQNEPEPTAARSHVGPSCCRTHLYENPHRNLYWDQKHSAPARHRNYWDMRARQSSALYDYWPLIKRKKFGIKGFLTTKFRVSLLNCIKRMMLAYDVSISCTMSSERSLALCVQIIKTLQAMNERGALQQPLLRGSEAIRIILT